MSPKKWAVIGTGLFVITAVFIAGIFSLNASESEVVGYLNLLGLGMFLLLGITILVAIDLLYTVLLLRWMALSKTKTKRQKANRVILS